MTKRYYIAYGSNLNIEQMRSRCPSATVAGVSAIPDYQLLFKGSQTGAYLTIEPHKGGCVPVAVWKVTPADERSLDRYEGCPRFYYKTEMDLPVFHVDGGSVASVSAFVYIMQEDRLPGIPMQYYVDTCLAGYRAFGFDESKLSDAIMLSLKRCREMRPRS